MGTGSESGDRNGDGNDDGYGDGIGDGKGSEMEREGGEKESLVSATSGKKQSRRPGTAISHAALSIHCNVDRK